MKLPAKLPITLDGRLDDELLEARRILANLRLRFVGDEASDRLISLKGPDVTDVRAFFERWPFHDYTATEIARLEGRYEND